MRTISTLVFTLLFAVTILSAKVIRVPQDYATIQLAMNAAINGDTVLVSEGTYFENLLFNGKKIVVASVFVKDNDTSHISKTIIDGSKPSSPDSASTVFFNGSTDTTSVITGFTIRGGNGTKQTFPEVWRYGGGVAVGTYYGTETYGASIKFNRITQNAMVATPSGAVCSGSAIAAWQGRGLVIIEDNVIEQNTTAGPGGGNNCVDIAEINCRIVRNTIRNNAVNYTNYNGISAGIYFQGFSVETRSAKKLWTAVIRGNTIIGNINNRGKCGGISIRGDSAYGVIENNNIAGNYASGFGGGMFIEYYAKASIRNNYFVNNTGKIAGGGIMLYNHCSATIAANYFKGNQTDSAGGAVEIAGSCVARLENNIFVRNRSAWGGGVAIESFSTGDLVNNTFNGNKADSGGAMELWNVSTARMMNNILWNDSAKTAPEAYLFPPSSGIGTSTLYTGYNLCAGLTGIGDISGDPGLVTGDSLMRLTDKSIAIAKGTMNATVGYVDLNAPPIDYFGAVRPRPISSSPDLGAVEHDSGKVTSAGNEHFVQHIPASLRMEQNYPNPFNPSTVISYQLPVVSKVTLKVYDVLGREVATLVNEEQSAGWKEVKWNASNFASGMYLVRMSANNFTETKKVLLMK